MSLNVRGLRPSDSDWVYRTTLKDSPFNCLFTILFADPWFFFPDGRIICAQPALTEINDHDIFNPFIRTLVEN